MQSLKEIDIAIRNELYEGVLTFDEIAKKLEIPRQWVDDVADEILKEQLTSMYKKTITIS